MTADPWQTKALKSSSDRLAFLCSRQIGKSTTAAALAIATALTEPGSLVLLLSPSLRQSCELFRKCMEFFEALGRPVAAINESATRLELANGSRIVSLPGSENTTRGFSGVRLLIVDEAAFCPDQLYFACRPMLATSKGRLVLLSTPMGKTGFFYHTMTDQNNGFEKVIIPATECKRIALEFLEEERRTLGPIWYAREYACEFSDSINQVFSTESIESATTETSVVPLF